MPARRCGYRKRLDLASGRFAMIYFNCGADGLMVPMVETAAQARAIVDTVRYACPADYENRLVICTIETLEAIANLDGILAVDVLFIGPGDLSQSMGCLPSVPLGEERPQPVQGAVVIALAIGTKRHFACPLTAI